MKRNEQTMEARLAALDRLDKAGLRKKFRELYGFDAVTCSWENLRMRVAYKIQENALGGLSEETKARLDAIADADPLSNLGSLPARRTTHARGARYVRAWKGRNYEVTIVDDGKFEFEGQIYTSLTAVAEKITGTHWNGRRFFGVK